MADWLIQCNPKVWDVWAWWENEDTNIDNWTISRRIDEISRGDRFAFWIGGKEAGVYALGTVAGNPGRPYRVRRGGYWIRPPKGEVRDIPLRVKHYFFDAPIRKADLV